MATFVRGVPQTTKESRVTVDAGLKPGLHRFSLVVVDDSDLASAASELVVEVREVVVPPVVVTPPVTTVPPVTTFPPSDDRASGDDSGAAGLTTPYLQ